MEPGGGLAKQSNPFQRGVMVFDDYNYNQHNPYILIKKAERGEKQETNEVGARSELQSVVLDNIDLPDYEHKAVEPLVYSPNTAAKMAAEGKDPNATPKEGTSSEKAKKKKFKKQKDQESESEGGQKGKEEEKNEEGEESDASANQVYYEPEEISMTKRSQSKDTFSDLQDQRKFPHYKK